MKIINTIFYYFNNKIFEHYLHSKIHKLYSNKKDYTIIGHEYEIGLGVGDFLIKNNNTGTIAVIEVKYIDNISTGKTARRRRTKNRKKVKEQAWYYARYAYNKYKNNKILIFIWTNEVRMKCLGKIENNKVYYYKGNKKDDYKDENFEECTFRSKYY